MIKRLTYLTFIAVTLLNTDVYAWGPNGHRIVGKIAENHLTIETRRSIYPLLQGDKLAEVSTWVDIMRSNPAEFWQRQSSKWRYINLDSTAQFKPKRYRITANRGKVTDIYSAILKSIAVLEDSDTSIDKKQFYLRFLVNLVGEVHQPLTVGSSKYKSGKNVKVTYFGNTTNLNYIWNRKLVQSESLSYTEFVEFIDTKNPQIISQYQASQPKDWVLESFQISQQIYGIEDKDLGYHYNYEQMPVVKERLLQGGIRLAGLLNKIFDKSAQVQVNPMD
jgi:hypothetical protein